jgi:hypothetical protein
VGGLQVVVVVLDELPGTVAAEQIVVVVQTVAVVDWTVEERTVVGDEPAEQTVVAVVVVGTEEVPVQTVEGEGRLRRQWMDERWVADQLVAVVVVVVVVAVAAEVAGIQTGHLEWDLLGVGEWVKQGWMAEQRMQTVVVVAVVEGEQLAVRRRPGVGRIRGQQLV